MIDGVNYRLNLIDCLSMKYIKQNSILAPSNNIYVYSFLEFLDGRNPASPADEKKQKQRLRMSQEKKDAQREKERLIKNAKHCTKTQEECDKRRKTKRDCMTRKKQNKTEEQATKCKKTMQECVSKQRQTETDEQAAERKKTNRDCLRRKREKLRHQSQNDSGDCNGEDMTNVIDCATKEAKQFLHRMRDPANPHKHRAIVCIICDRFIIGTETIHKLTKEDIGAHSERLGVKSYEEYYQTTLKAKVKKEYQVQGLQDMLLSPRSRKYVDGYTICSVCYTGMQPQMASKRTPPKFAIANGSIIGSFPQEIKFINKEGRRVTRKVEDDELTDTLKAMVAPLRPYGCVFAYSRGAQTSLRSKYQFFEMDQNRLGGVINHLNQAGIGEHIYCVL